MVYVTIKEDTAEKVHFSQKPSTSSWSLLLGFCAFGLGAAYYGNDHIVWKIVYVSLGVIVGISCFEEWEECEFDKQKSEVRLRKHSAWDRILSPFSFKQDVIVAHLPDINEVRVEKKVVNFFGNTHQVVLVFNTGMSLGITETFTFGSDEEHKKVAEKIRTFLDLGSPKENIEIPEPAYPADNSTTDDQSETDDFEQIDKSELLDETEQLDIQQTANVPSVETDDKDDS